MNKYSKDGKLHDVAAEAVRAVIASQSPPFSATLEVESEDDAWKAVIQIEVRENK